jgi:hypothetical protein
MASNRIQWKDVPLSVTFFDLVTSLRERKTLHLPNGAEFYVNGIEAEDGSGHSWNVEGYTKDSTGHWWQFHVYWHERNAFSLLNATIKK